MDAATSSPVIPSTLAVTTIILMLGFTAPRSPFRYLGFILMTWYVRLALVAQRKSADVTSLQVTICVGPATGMLMQYLDSVLLSQWSYEAKGPTSDLGGQKSLRIPKKDSKHNTILLRLKFGLEEAFRGRSARTPWEVSNVPPFSPDDPEQIPTKKEFLYSMATEMMISLLALDILSLLGRDTSMSFVYFAASKVPLFTRLQEVTLEEVLLRTIASIMHWIATIWLLQVVYDAAAIITIASGLGRVERWPPLFNAWVHCWSIRQFWGYDWTNELSADTLTDM